MFRISAYSRLFKSIAFTMLAAGLTAAQVPLEQSVQRQFRQTMSSHHSATSILAVSITWLREM